MTNINIVTLDFSLEKPIRGLDKTISEFRTSEIIRVPIIRIFGTTLDGVKCCAHIHGVFPYFYIPFDGIGNPNAIAYQTAIALDKTLNTALNKASSNQQHVYNVSLVSAIPFYGFHANEHQFFKLAFYNPMMVKKAAALLQNGSILGKIFQPHETHIPFIQQFMIDFNLFGMNFIRFAKVEERTPNTQNPKTTHCEYEFDVLGEHILNRLDVIPYNVSANPGIQYICNDEIQRRENNGEKLELSMNLTQNRLHVPPTPSHENFKATLVKIMEEKKDLVNSGKDLANCSVYAAETPDSQQSSLQFKAAESILDATNLDITLAESSEVEEAEETILGEDAIALLKSIFEKDENDESINNEFDSILSQVSEAQISEDEDKSNDELDLSMSLVEAFRSSDNTFSQNIATVLSQIEQKEANEAEAEDLWNKSLFTLDFPKIDQLDGACDEEDEEACLKIPKRQLRTRRPPKVTKKETSEIHTETNEQDANKKQLKTTNAEVKTVETNKKQSEITEKRKEIKEKQLDTSESQKEANNRGNRDMKISFRRSNSGKFSDGLSKLEENKKTRQIGKKACLANVSDLRFPKLNATIESPKAHNISKTFDIEDCLNEDSNEKQGSAENLRKVDLTTVEEFVECRYVMEGKQKSQEFFIENETALKTSGNGKKIKDLTLNSDNVKEKPTKSLNLQKEAIKNVNLPENINENICLETKTKENLKLKGTNDYINLENKTCFNLEEASIIEHEKNVTSESDEETGLFPPLFSPESYDNDDDDTFDFNYDEKTIEKNHSEEDQNEENRIELQINGIENNKSLHNENQNKRQETVETNAVLEYDKKLNIFPKAGPSTKLSQLTPDIITSQSSTNNSEDSDNIPILCKNTPDSCDSIPKLCNLSTEVNKTVFSNSTLQFCSGTFDSTPENQNNTMENETNLETKPSLLIESLTLYQKTSNLNKEHIESDLDSSTLNGSTYLVPKYNPPSRKLIQDTLDEFNIHEHKYQAPFYSNYKDATGAVDVGFNTLSISVKNNFADFKSNFGTLQEYQKLQIGDGKVGEARKKLLNTIKLSHWSSNSCVVTPVRKPPTFRDVKIWALKRTLDRRKRDTCDQNARSDRVFVKEDSLSPVLNQSPKLKQKSILTKNANLNKTQIPIENQKSLDSNQISNENPRQNLNITRNSILMQSQIPSPNSVSPQNFLSDLTNSHMISGPSPNNTFGFKMTLENYQEARTLSNHQFITSLVMELHVDTRDNLQPDPDLDPVKAIFFALFDDVPRNSDAARISCGYIYVDDQKVDETDSKNKVMSQHMFSMINSKENSVYNAKDELDLFSKFKELFLKWNPDILLGYEIETTSWGYLVDRGQNLGFNLLIDLSRIKEEKPRQKFLPKEQDPEEDLHTDLKISGRIVLDLWRVLRHEMGLQSYTFENLAYHVLHERVPTYSHKTLSQWWNSKKQRHLTLNHYLYRVEGAFRLMDHFDLIGRTSELARLIGITFYEVLSRGSQFRVESMMLRLAKPYNYIPCSPSEYQRAHMKAPEFIPLVLEPESKFYKDPVIVLDFQSLYPSIMIAYNYCFSTCLGNVRKLGSEDPFEFGAYQLKVSRKRLRNLLKRDLINFSPCGVAFVKESERKGIMPRMLQEILDTRLMVKKSMKRNKSNKTLQKVLHSRQLGLKLIANVTYGYTAANFSGRMPSVEVGDSVVSKGRETLQRAISLVEQCAEWKARVVYGDTDSLFVLVPGRSRDEAFKIGEEIALAVTNDNPSPVRLKLEKVYHPCILQTKKRYVGYMFESPDQARAQFEAKGIETVRRDGCPAASKMLEKTLKLLFDTRDVSLIKTYVLKQFSKIISGRVSLQDLTFAKEYRGRAGYKKGACVPALELAKKWLNNDKRSEPRRGERVPYVIINGPPGLPLIRLVKHPLDLLDDPNLRLNATYYITKAIIPPLNRCFKLIGADLLQWYNEMPRKLCQTLQSGSPSKGPKSTINQYFGATICASCSRPTPEKLCPKCKCKENTQQTLCILNTKINSWERKYCDTRKICESCCCRTTDLFCISLDCPVLYKLKQCAQDYSQTDFVRDIIDNCY